MILRLGLTVLVDFPSTDGVTTLNGAAIDRNITAEKILRNIANSNDEIRLARLLDTLPNVLNEVYHKNGLINGRKTRSLSRTLLLTQHFNEKIISPGDDVSLQCSASSLRAPRVLWERDGVVLSSNIDQRYSLGQIMTTTGTVVSSLNISRARVEDGGLYTCTAVDGEAMASHSARINVYGPPYIRNLPPIKIQSGQEMKMRCPFYGYPVNKIEWEHKGKKILSATLPQISRYKRNHATARGSRIFKKTRRKRRQVYEAIETGLLIVPRVTKEDHGASYTCVVYSPSGEMARRSFEIQVVEAPELDELRVGSGLKEGQIVQITCNIIGGDPPIYFSWLKDGMKIPPSLKVTEKSLEFFSVLVIKKVSLEHVGKYTCMATNHVGKTNQTADLYINVAPKWIEEPRNSSLLLGQRGVVHCSANGFPAPQTHWMKRDAALGIWRPVLDLAGGGVMSLNNGTLIIEVVSTADEGTYACNVENGVGEPLSKNIWISVNKPVHFESPSTNLTTKIGLPVALTCHALGDNPIRIKWLHNGLPMDFTSSRVSLQELPSYSSIISTININYADGSDRGIYECRASNQYGKAEHLLYLVVLEPPTPPMDLQIDSISSRSARISWRDTIRTHVQYYSVQYTIGDFLNWDGAQTVNVTRLSSEIRQSTELVDLKPAQVYRVRVASGNQVDISQYTQSYQFTTQQEAPSSPPIGVQVQSTENPGELTVSWLPPVRETTNGLIQGYQVRVEPKITADDVKSQTKIIKVMPRSGKHETTIGGLLKNTRYAVSVSAFNAAGNGPFSMPVLKVTREGAPEAAPSNVECRGVSSTSLRVAWQPIIVHGSSILGYYVYYSNEDGSWQNISSSHTETFLQSLMKYTNYSIKIAGYSNYGIGPSSHPIACATLQDVPGPPSSIKTVVASTSSLLVSWSRPEHPNGEITHYTVYVKLTSSSLSSQSFRVEPTPESELPTRYMTYEIKNLSEGKQYEASVSASTIAGEGVPSSSQSIEIGARVVAGVASLGGTLTVGVGSSLLLVCQCVGVPQPRTVWYHKQNIITHHPRFTRNHDDSLLINNIDISLSGNYTCLARNLYGSDSVSYLVHVLPAPKPPIIKAEPGSHELRLTWDPPTSGTKIAYNISWTETRAAWQGNWSSKGIQGRLAYVIDGLKCGTKYSIRMTSSNSVGTSSPAYLDVSTLGGEPLAPSNTEWFWSNSTHIFIQLTGWEDNGCDITGWTVEYRPYGTREWLIVENSKMQSEPQWKKYLTPTNQLSTIIIPDLMPAYWYQIKVTAENSAGVTISVFNYATTTALGESIGPPSDFLDLNTLVIILSSILLSMCFGLCIHILLKRRNQQRFSEYRDSLTVECKSERSNVTVNTPQSVTEANRIYSTPIHVPSDTKHELYEISPYAQFAIGFRTFGHVENQEVPRMPHGSGKSRYDSETSFQVRSESDESDCMSRTTTLKSVPRKSCRVQHHHR